MRGRYRTRWGRAQRPGFPFRRGGGYNLVILMVIIALMNIAIAASLPTWTSMAQRDREAELVFRGLQYAEAIRVFQLPPPMGQGRLPIRLEELLEVEPRSIRQLWTNPLAEDAGWKLIVEAGRNRPETPPNQSDNLGTTTSQPEELADSGLPNRNQSVTIAVGGDGQQVQGPFRGVMSSEGGESFLTFFDSNEIADWQFTADLVTPRSGPGTVAELQNVAGGWPANADTLWRPFPPGLDPRQQHGQGNGNAFGGGPGNALNRQPTNETKKP